MKISGHMNMPQVRAILSSWTNDAPPPVRTQLLVLTSLAKLKAKARSRTPLADALASAMRAWRPPRKKKQRSPKEVDPCRLSTRQLAKALTAHARTVGDWADKGLIPSFMDGDRRRFSLVDVRAALHALSWSGGPLYDPTSPRGKSLLTRKAEAATDARSCTRCKRSLPLDQFIAYYRKDQRLKSGGYNGYSSDCRDCRKEQKREGRRRKAEAQGKPFAARGDRQEWSKRRELRDQKKIERKVAWAICLAFWKLCKLSPEEKRRKNGESAARRAREQYRTDPSYRAYQLRKKRRQTERRAARAGRKAMTRAEWVADSQRRAAERTGIADRAERLRAQRKAQELKRDRAKRSTAIEPVSTLRVAARDGWLCGICGKRVKREDWSLDHIVPLCEGGPHTYENVVLAHRLCNSRRGVGRLPVQPHLFPRS